MDRDSMEAVMDRMDGMLDILDGIPRFAFATYRSYKPEHLIDHTARAQANCIYDHMAAEAGRRLDEISDVRPIELKGLRLWVFGDHTIIRFKKMDEDGRSRNYPTKQAKAFDHMRELDGIPPLPTRITVGYLPDRASTKIQRVQISRPNGREIDWCAAIVPVEQRAADARKWEDVTRQLRAVA